MPLLEPVLLGHDSMDATHQEFIELVNRLQVTSSQNYAALFHELVRHTEQHFGNELNQMNESGFPALAEHHADHDRILGQLTQFQKRVDQGRLQLARAFVSEQLPSWFNTHLATMDSALAAHLNSKA